MHEQKMLEKYETLAGMENATCPTCDGDIDQVFVSNMIKEHEERIQQCEKFANKDRERLQEIEEQNEIHRKATENIQSWEDITAASTTNSLHKSLTEKSWKVIFKRFVRRLPLLEQALSEVVEENERRERHNTRIGIIQEQTASFKSSWYHSRMGYKVQKTNLRYLKYLKKHLVQTVYSRTKSSHLSKS